ncbi:DUF3293 domain-containing protein [Aeromonas bivalvium]|uniref:DUF3293 domain-containing protein n=1 Tax=Aeromonas bivalvium TaxID=440079 RepID=UPI0038D07E80
MIDMILWENYRNICFIAPFSAPTWPGYTILTACNPASLAVGERRNGRRTRALLRAVTGWEHRFPIQAGDPEMHWQEWSLALACSAEEGHALAARFGQNALYRVEQGQLWLQPVLLDGPAVCLGEIGSFWRQSAMTAPGR